MTSIVTKIAIAAVVAFGAIGATAPAQAASVDIVVKPRVVVKPAHRVIIRPAPVIVIKKGQGRCDAGLALARACLKPARLLLLDEPTADLDVDAEAGIIASITALRGGRTVIVATHSEAMAAAADVVVRLT